MTPRTRGLTLAFGTAAISGVAVFVNSYGVRAVPDATVYTTAKNLVAAALLALLAVAAVRSRGAAGHRRPALPRKPAQLAGLLGVGVIGGSVPFVLFFEGLARAESTQAAFIHKTLLVWVALMAVPLLGERLRGTHVAAIALLLTGQALLGGGLPGLGAAGGGEALILGATLLWSVEVVVAKWLLRGTSPATLGLARMGLGAAVLLGWVAVSGRFDTLTGLTATGWMWAAVTGAILAGYVATWFGALSLAPAVDVTAVLVVAAIVTGLLNAAVNGAVPTGATAFGMVLLATGAGLIALAQARPRELAAAP